MLIATKKAVYRLDGSGKEEEPPVAYRESGVRRVAEGERLEAVALEDGAVVLLRDDFAQRLPTGIAGSIHSLLIVREDPPLVLIGTEPPHLYFLEADAEGAEQIGPFDELEVREKWYTPWGGPPAVRSLAATTDGWVYADIHVGSIMRSPDEGITWEPVTPDLHKDVHQVATCPADDDRVYAQTYDAFWLSCDRGESWEHRAADLDERYGRCVTAHPQDPDLLLCTVSDGPHGENVHGQLYRSRDAGRNWTHVADGFPDSAEDNIDTFHVTFSPRGTAWGAVGQDLYLGGDRATEWSRFWRAPDPILMLACRHG